jgi:hypothetical protein
MRGLARYLLPLCLVTALGGCAGGYYNEGSSGYASGAYYGDYSYAPSYGLGFTYYGDGGGDHWHHWAPRNDWNWRGNGGSHNHWQWHSASNGWQRGGGHR